MALRVVIGAANSGKSEALAARLRTCAADRQPALLLLPTAPEVSRASAVYARVIPLGLQIATFDDFLAGLWQRRGDGRHIVTPAQRRALLEEVVNERIPDGTLPGGTTGVFRTLGTLVQRAAEAEGWSHPEGASAVCAALMDHVTAYQRIVLRSGCIEPAEAHRLAVERMREGDAPGLLAIDGFTSLTVAQESLVRQASKHGEVHVALTYDQNVPATFAAAPLVERLARHGVIDIVRDAADDVAPELSRIASSLGGGRVVGDATGAVALSEAWGPHAEAARIAAEVQCALSGGAQPGEIAVVFRDAGRHADSLRQAFEEAGIPSEFDMRVPLDRTAVGRTVLLMLRLGGARPSRDTLMDVLRSPYSPLDHSRADELDAYLRRSTGDVVAAARGWCARNNDKETEAFLREAVSLCREPVSAAAERRWYRLVTSMIGRARPSSIASDPQTIADAAAVRVLLEAVRSMAAVTSRGLGALSLASVLKDATVSVQSDGSSAYVQVLSAERARSGRYRCVIVGGLVAGEFPRPSRESVLSAGRVGEGLMRAGIDTAVRGGLEQERLLFYQVVTRASERLVLSWQSHDPEGRPRSRSVFVSEVLDLYPPADDLMAAPPGMSMRALGLDSFGLHEAAPITHRRALRMEAIRAGEAGCADVAHEDVALARRRSRGAQTTLSREVARRASERTAFSASEIETYLQCPFRWCIQHHVRPRSLDVEFDASARGRVAHEVLAAFYEAFHRETGLARVTPDALEQAWLVHGTVTERVLARVRTTTVAEEMAARSAIAGTRAVIEADAELLPGMAPLAHEWAFGLNGDTPEDLGSFALQGRVDRIDTDGAVAMVADYKTGTVDRRRAWQSFDEGGVVQLPLYAAVVSRRLGLPVGVGLYRPVGPGKPRGFVREDLIGPAFVSGDAIDADGIDGLIRGAVARASAAVDAMRTGSIEACPPERGCPEHCPAAMFCSERRSGSVRA